MKKIMAILMMILCTSLYAEEKDVATHSWSPSLYEAINLVGKRDIIEIDFPKDNKLGFAFYDDSKSFIAIENNPEMYHIGLSNTHEGKITAKIDTSKFKQMTSYELISISKKVDKKDMRPTITVQFVPGFVQRISFAFSDDSNKIYTSTPKGITYLLGEINNSLEKNGFEKTFMGKVNSFINEHISDTLISQEYYKDDVFVKVIYTDTGFFAIQVYTKEAEREFMKNYQEINVNRQDLSDFLSTK